MTKLWVVLGMLGAIGMLVALVISRVEGAVWSDKFPRQLGGARARVRAVIKDYGCEQRGRWAWNYEGKAFYRAIGLWWWIPTKLSMGAFNILVMEQTVNGKDA